jgi:hypothetical protein
LVLDFIETYNRFESDDNDEDVPTLCLSYRRRSQDGVETTALSTFGTERLGQLFKQVSQQDNVKALVDSAISDRAPDSHPSPGVPPCRW